MKTKQAIDIIRRFIDQGLTNDQIRNLPMFQIIRREYGYVLTDAQIDMFRTEHGVDEYIEYRNQNKRPH